MKKIFNLLILIGILYSCQREEIQVYEITDPDFNLMPAKAEILNFPSGATVKKVGNDYIWMGDILLSPSQLEEVKTKGFISGTLQTREKKEPNTSVHPLTNMPLNPKLDPNASVGIGGYYPAQTWAMVRYVYSPNLTQERKEIIKEAIRHWEANTNVRFYNATNQPTRDPQYGFNYPYIEFVNGTVNSSSIGLIGGRQVINLAQFQYSRAAIHEIGHAIGLFHEQSAGNRDNYMNVNFSNIKPEMRYNFDKVRSNYYQIGLIDFNSIMMYGSYITDPAIVYNPNIPVLTKKDGSTWLAASVLSPTDKMWANTFYIPYIARSDIYRELADVVYKPDNTIMTPQERLALQARLNNGNPYPPAGGRIPNTP
ncbi:hypothetical protein CMU93_04805 [Elizabethkingia anophelis]|nr:hypothetical protein [Elizabethkingia anophelis]